MRKKWEYNLYSFYDRTGIEAHLEAMAAKGWLLEKIDRVFWRYRRIEPRTVHISVVYFAPASEFDCGPGEAQQTFQDYCREAGWTQLAGWSQMLVFYSEAPQPVPIETDAAAQVAAVHAAMKKNFLITNVLMAILALIQALRGIRDLVTSFTDTLADPASLSALTLWLLLSVFSLTEIITYFLWRRKALAAAQQKGRFTSTRGHRGFQTVLLIISGVMLVWLVLSVSRPIALVTLGAVAWVWLLEGALSLLRRAMRRTGWSTEVNRIATQVLSFLLALAFVGGMYYVIFRLFRERPWQQTYTWQGETYDLHPADLPLTVGQLTGQPYDHVSREILCTRTPFLARLSGQETVGLPDGQERLSYTVTDILHPWLRQAVTRDLLENADLHFHFHGSFTVSRSWQPEPEDGWGADAAYRLRYDENDELVDEYLLFYGDRVVDVQLPFTPDSAQRACIAQALFTV